MKAEKEVIRAIYHKDVADFLESMGVSEKLARGEIHCAICGAPITVDNFRAVARKSDELLFCCDKESCIQEFSSLLRGDKT